MATTKFGASLEQGGEQPPASSQPPAPPPPPSTPEGQPGSLAAENAATSYAGDKVVVANKMPSGVVLRGFRASEEYEPVLGGGSRKVTVYRETEERVVIAGTRRPFGQTGPELVAGYRLTHGVDRELWENWFQANKNSDMVKNKLIFANPDVGRSQDEARDNERRKTGFEGVDPENPGRSVRIPQIERGDRPRA